MCKNSKLNPLEDCRVRVIESHPEGLTPEIFVDLENYDRERLRATLDTGLQAFDLYGPSFELGHISGLHEMSRQERRVRRAIALKSI